MHYYLMRIPHPIDKPRPRYSTGYNKNNNTTLSSHSLRASCAIDCVLKCSKLTDFINLFIWNTIKRYIVVLAEIDLHYYHK